ncbi:uncharacterized protein V1510DRAFT_351183, partial [Dipodascopsis tothii]|uniref:uncharacterized protein n=1 Tax=Dipodascopsis tothii TaxID=44089 RepID=UPI0034CF67DB
WRHAEVLIGSTRFPDSAGIRNILVTGGQGFIASWLVRHLAIQYPHYTVVCFDKLDYCASLNNTGYLAANCANYRFEKGDVTSPADVARVLETHAIDTVIHLAAMSHVDLSFAGSSFEFTSTNVYGTHVLLECAKNYGRVSSFVHVSTDEVYGEVSEAGSDLLETSILSPTNPYAASKAAADMLVNAYYKSYGLPVVVVRCNNVYGPHQFPEKIIPKFICRLNRGLPCVVHGDGSNSRRYLYAGDAVDALDTILHLGKRGQIYNIGTPDEVSNLDLCRLIIERVGAPADAIAFSVDRPFNDRRYAIDATRLRDLGWTQRTPFADGLAATVAWYARFGETWWGDISSSLSAFPTKDH